MELYVLMVWGEIFLGRSLVREMNEIKTNTLYEILKEQVKIKISVFHTLDISYPTSLLSTM